MVNATPKTPFDLAREFWLNWPLAQHSNWQFAEREDLLEDKAVSSMQRYHKTVWLQAEKALDDHMAFVSHRLHEDFECAKALGQCNMPDEAFTTLQAFFSRMTDEYKDHAQSQFELLQEGLRESAVATEELQKVAADTTAEFSEAIQDNQKRQSSTKSVKRARTTA